jgi:uncharacterized protein (DUF488 family)
MGVVMIASRQNDHRTLFTIGYEGLDLPSFLKFLVFHKVDVLVDVREIPLSRKKGFSKSQLADALDRKGIRYEHIKALGSPSPIRKQLKADWDYDAFFSAYDEYLADQKEALDRLREIVEENKRVCLMCFEKSHDQCHRRSVARRAARRFPGRLSVEPVETWVK